MVFCNFFYFLCMKLSWSCDPGRRFNWVEQVDLGCFSFIFLFLFYHLTLSWKLSVVIFFRLFFMGCPDVMTRVAGLTD